MNNKNELDDLSVRASNVLLEENIQNKKECFEILKIHGLNYLRKLPNAGKRTVLEIQQWCGYEETFTEIFKKDIMNAKQLLENNGYLVLEIDSLLKKHPRYFG